jgi:hypothetical protein
MFGLGKVFSGFFESIGMGWMGNVLSLATNFMTGNWMGVAQDIFRLVSEFSNDSWASRVDRDQPLGAFGRSSCFGDFSLSESRISDLQSRADRDTSVNTRRAFHEVASILVLQSDVEANRRRATATAIA